MSRITQIFYGNDCLPYKDSERTVHYPITGCSFAGSSNVNELHFYTRDIGGVNNLSWVAIVKLPNGKILYQLLTDIHLDSEINEYYVSFNLSSFYTQLKGDIYISLNGCVGQVEIETDEETDISTIQGEIDSKTIVATGAVKFTINYAPQRPIGYSFDLDQYQLIINALASKANIVNTIQVVADISQEDMTGYDIGQLFYNLANNLYYYKKSNGDAGQVDGGVLASERIFLRQEFGNLSINVIKQAIGDRITLVKYNNREYLMKISDGSSGSKAYVTLVDIELRCIYFAADISIATAIGSIISDTYRIRFVEQTSLEEVLYGTDGSGNQTTIDYGVDPDGNYIVQRTANGDIVVNQTPTNNLHATSKKYVDDLIATIKSNAFILVNTTTYPTLASFLASTGEEGYIYLYPVDESGFDEGDPQKGYYQYIWEGSEWLLLGTTQIDLSDYYTKSQTITLLNTRVEKKYDNGTVYAIDNSGNQIQLHYDWNADVVGYWLVQRDANGQVNVPPPTYFTHATNKEYVDDQDTALDNAKVDKTNSGEKVYGTDELGAQMTYDVDSDLVGDGAIVRRNTPSGTIVTGTPTSNTHATTKAYVDSSIANAISNVYKIKGSASVSQINAMTNQQVGDVYNLLDSGTIVLGNLQVFTGDNIVWTGSAWDKLGAEIDWTAYDEKFIAAGFFEVQPYNESTGEITIVYSTELYVMSYDGDTGVMTIEAN